MKGGARAYNHRLNFVATQRMYGKSSAKFKSSREEPCVWLNSHYHTKVLKKKKNQLHSQVSTEASFSWKVMLRLSWKECKASYFKHSRNEYKWGKLPNLSWWKLRANSCAIPQQKRSVYRKKQFSHTIVFARFYIAIWWKDLGPLHSESYVASIRISMHTNPLLL